MLARHDLGLSEREFWCASPRQIHALLVRHTERVRAEREAAEYRAGMIAVAIYNAMGVERESGSRPWAPSDFFPSLAAAPAEQDEETMVAVAASIVRMYGGEDLRKG